MRLREAMDLFESNCEFPTDHDRLVDRVGDARIDPPNGDPVDVATALERTDERTYRSARGAAVTLVGNLPAAHVGRPAYDDRSPTVFQHRELSF